MDLDIKLKFNFNKRNRYKNICSIEGCNNSACGKLGLVKNYGRNILNLFINIELIQVK